VETGLHRIRHVPLYFTFASAVVHTDGPVNRCAKSIKETIH